MPATIKCAQEIQEQIVERVVRELIEALEPLDLDFDDDLDEFVKELVVVTDKGIKVEYPVDEVYCNDVYEYLGSIVQIFKGLKAD